MQSFMLHIHEGVMQREVMTEVTLFEHPFPLWVHLPSPQLQSTREKK
jgi:hypothetical protein